MWTHSGLVWSRRYIREFFTTSVDTVGWRFYRIIDGLDGMGLDGLQKNWSHKKPAEHHGSATMFAEIAHRLSVINLSDSRALSYTGNANPLSDIVFRGNRLVLERNDAWWGGRTHWTRVTKKVLVNDAARVAWKPRGANRWGEAHVMDFKTAEATEMWVGRTVASKHNTSAPDMVLGRFKAEPKK